MLFPFFSMDKSNVDSNTLRIDSRDSNEIWSTVGVSENIIEASWQALADSFQFKLANEKRIRSKKYPAQEELPIFVKP